MKRAFLFVFIEKKKIEETTSLISIKNIKTKKFIQRIRCDYEQKRNKTQQNKKQQ